MHLSRLSLRIINMKSKHAVPIAVLAVLAVTATMQAKAKHKYTGTVMYHGKLISTDEYRIRENDRFYSEFADAERRKQLAKARQKRGLDPAPPAAAK